MLPKDPIKALECRLRMSEAKKGKRIIYKNPIKERERRKRMSVFQPGNKIWSGRHHNEETKIKQSLAHKGRVFSEEHCKKISESKKGKPWNCKDPFILAERNRKISKAHKGKKFSDEHRKHLSEAFKNKAPVSENTRKRMSLARKGRPQPGGFGEIIQRRMQILRENPEKFKEWCNKISQSRIGKYGGDKDPAWKGGISFEPYCPKFNREFKERVRAYFNYICLECGTPIPKGLMVHHINFNKMSCCDDTIPLFVPLCNPCHGKTNARREFWERYFTEMIDGYYQGKCYFTKDEMKIFKNS